MVSQPTFNSGAFHFGMSSSFPQVNLQCTAEGTVKDGVWILGQLAYLYIFLFAPRNKYKIHAILIIVHCNALILDTRQHYATILESDGSGHVAHERSLGYANG